MALRRSRARVTARAFEIRDARPQAHVDRGRVLRLQEAHSLQSPRDRHARPLEEQLAGEQGPVQLARSEHPLGHG